MAETTEDRADRPRRVIVLRHGQTDHNAAGIWQGHLDSHLSAVGEAQARNAAAALSAFAIDRVVASDLVRAAETGRVVAEAVGVPLEIDERFREIHAGEWQGLTGAQVREQFPEDQDKLLSGEDFKRGRTGESVGDVADRVAGALEEVLSGLEPGHTVLIATHGVTGRTVAAQLVGIPQELAWQALAGLGNCHWVICVEGRSGWRIQEWNARAHGADDTSIW